MQTDMQVVVQPATSATKTERSDFSLPRMQGQSGSIFQVPDGDSLTLGTQGQITVKPGGAMVGEEQIILKRFSHPDGSTALTMEEGNVPTVTYVNGKVLRHDQVLSLSPGDEFRLGGAKGPTFRVTPSHHIAVLKPEQVSIPQTLLVTPTEEASVRQEFSTDCRPTVDQMLGNLGIVPPAMHRSTLKVSNSNHQKAISQSQHFALHGEIGPTDKLVDGFCEGGPRMRLDSRGKLLGTPQRTVLVVDRVNDPVLQKAIKQIKRRMHPSFTADTRTLMLMDYVNSLTTPGKGGSVAYGRFDDLYPKGEVLLGEVITNQKGGDYHRALLYKVLADAVGVNASMVRGTKAGNTYYWNEVEKQDGRKMLVDCWLKRTLNEQDENRRYYYGPGSKGGFGGYGW